MKTLFFSVLLATLGITGCSKINATSNTPLDERPDSLSSQINFQGTFVDGPSGQVSGDISIFSDSSGYHLALSHFTSSNGPDLHVYLSQESFPIHFIELGKLKSVQGNQLYDIPGKPDFKIYKYIQIHCQQYNHLFGVASF